jgi:hypothetical protein
VWSRTRLAIHAHDGASRVPNGGCASRNAMRFANRLMRDSRGLRGNEPSNAPPNDAGGKKIFAQ